VRVAADTSVVLPALLADHEAHDAAAQALSECTATIAHVLLEAYSVLTRLPPPHRAPSSAVAPMLKAHLPPAVLALPTDAYAAAPARMAAASVSGGAAYDGLIALTALEHDLELVSRDGRATRSYRALGVRLRLLE
jgi:predicted nucleic acid-binding protein